MEPITDKEEKAAVVAGTADLKLKQHPLQFAWKLWYFNPKNMKGKSWEDSINEISSFKTVEEFWSIFNHLKTPGEIPTGYSYYVFKDGIKPMWEDKANCKGGRWAIPIEKNQDKDKKWEELLMCLVGEAFGNDGDDVCGAVVDIRKRQDRISLWTGNVANMEQILNIGRKIKERLNTSNGLLSYESHQDNALKTSAYVKPIFVL